MQLAASVSSAHLKRRQCAGFMVVEVEEVEEGCLRGLVLHLEVNGFFLPQVFFVCCC